MADKTVTLVGTDRTGVPVLYKDNGDGTFAEVVSASVVAGTSGDIADDAAFTPATSRVVPAGFLADETAPDSVDEGDVGAARMTLDRLLRAFLTVPYNSTLPTYTNAQVVSCFVENGQACLAIRVAEPTRNVEYIGRCDLTPEFAALSGAEKKAALVAAAKAVRDTQQATPPAAPSISGTVTV